MKDLKTLQKTEPKTQHITIRITPKMRKWLDQHKISPTRLFNKTLENLGYQE